MNEILSTGPSHDASAFTTADPETEVAQVAQVAALAILATSPTHQVAGATDDASDALGAGCYPTNSFSLLGESGSFNGEYERTHGSAGTGKPGKPGNQQPGNQQESAHGAMHMQTGKEQEQEQEQEQGHGQGQGQGQKQKEQELNSLPSPSPHIYFISSSNSESFASGLPTKISCQVESVSVAAAAAVVVRGGGGGGGVKLSVRHFFFKGFVFV